MNPIQEMRRIALDHLWERSERDHWQGEPAFSRRRWVVAAFVVIGAGVLAWSLRIEPGSTWFYPATLLLAVVWAVGAFASGPLHLGRVATQRRPIIGPILIGLVLAGVFMFGALVVREIPWLASQVRAVLAHANEGAGPVLLLITVLNGIAEELFFRGGAYAALRGNQVSLTTIAYAVATAATGNVMLSFAALLLGVVVGMERRATGGILAPILTHVTWSVTMLYALPWVLRT